MSVEYSVIATSAAVTPKPEVFRSGIDFQHNAKPEV